jgi:hypothetical protein
MHDRKSRQGGADRLAKTPPLRRRLHGLVLAAAALIFGALAIPQAFAAGEPDATASKPFTICDDQTYALCFSARCTMFMRRRARRQCQPHAALSQGRRLHLQRPG